MSNVRGGSPHVIRGASPIHRLRFRRTTRLTCFNTGVLRPAYVLPTGLGGVPIHLLGAVRPRTPNAVVSGVARGKGVGTITTGSGVASVGVGDNHVLLTAKFLQGMFRVFRGCRAPVSVMAASRMNISIAVSGHGRLRRVISSLGGCKAIAMSRSVIVIYIMNSLR